MSRAPAVDEITRFGFKLLWWAPAVLRILMHHGCSSVQMKRTADFQDAPAETKWTLVDPRILLGALLVAMVAIPRVVLAGDGLDQARRNYPPLIMGANTRAADGAGPFARACPVGGRVEREGGPATEYLGSDPTYPALCRMRVAGQAVEAWYGIWLTTWPGADLAHAAMDRLIRGRTGDIEAFDVRIAPNYSFHDVMRNDGVEDIRLLGRVYRAVKISHYREGAEGNIYRSVTTGWKDLGSGLLIYVTYQHIAGAPEIHVPLIPAAIVPSP